MPEHPGQFVWCPHCDQRHAANYDCRSKLGQSDATDRLLDRMTKNVEYVMVARYGARTSSETTAQAGALARAALAEVDSFDTLAWIAQQILDAHYPAASVVCDREADDPGPRLAAALRDVLTVEDGDD